MAVIEAFEHIKKGTSVELHADSKYVLKTIDGQFSRKKNLDLWERLDKACEGLELSLCWVPGHRGHYYKQKLSDRARKLKSGDLISCRVVFDAGIHSKAVGFEFKRSGLYTLAMKDEQKTYILHGHAEKVIHGKNGYCGIYVPIKRYQNGSFQTVWYLASFFNSNISVVKGDTVFLRGYRISDKSYNGFDYLDLTCSDIIGIHNL